MTNFQLHPRLAQDCYPVASLPLCDLLMMNDSQYPWFILVPRRAELSEIYQLDQADRQQLLSESCSLAEQLQALYQPDKLNIAAIGNLVPQLHLHHVCRFTSDVAWPAPIWGKFPPSPYRHDQAQLQIAALQQALKSCFTAK